MKLPQHKVNYANVQCGPRHSPQSLVLLNVCTNDPPARPPPVRGRLNLSSRLVLLEQSSNYCFSLDLSSDHLYTISKKLPPFLGSRCFY